MRFSTGEYGDKNLQSVCYFSNSNAVILWAMKYVAYRIHTRDLVLDLSSDCKNSRIKVASVSTRVRESYIEVLGFNKAFLVLFVRFLACKKCRDVLKVDAHYSLVQESHPWIPNFFHVVCCKVYLELNNISCIAIPSGVNFRLSLLYGQTSVHELNSF
jgi:hypothetical protein